MRKYWEAGGVYPQKQQSKIGVIVLMIFLAIAAAYAGVLGYKAMVHEMSRYDTLRSKRAEQSALMKLQQPMKYSDAAELATVWELTKE
jgi:hypothetical protein